MAEFHGGLITKEQQSSFEKKITTNTKFRGPLDENSPKRHNFLRFVFGFRQLWKEVSF